MNSDTLMPFLRMRCAAMQADDRRSYDAEPILFAHTNISYQPMTCTYEEVSQAPSYTHRVISGSSIPINSVYLQGGLAGGKFIVLIVIDTYYSMDDAEYPTTTQSICHTF